MTVMRTERPPLMLTALTLILLAGCGGSGDTAPTVPKTATGSLEQIASQGEVRSKSADRRHRASPGQLRTDDGRYVLATFATDRGQWEWINEAKDYGGSYLVGRKWVVVGDPRVVTALRARLGGTVETGRPITGPGPVTGRVATTRAMGCPPAMSCPRGTT